MPQCGHAAWLTRRAGLGLGFKKKFKFPGRAGPRRAARACEPRKARTEPEPEPPGAARHALAACRVQPGRLGRSPRVAPSRRWQHRSNLKARGRLDFGRLRLAPGAPQYWQGARPHPREATTPSRSPGLSASGHQEYCCRR
jgi:hypothetical protein